MRCLTIAGGSEQILLTWPANGYWACRKASDVVDWNVS